MLCLPVPVGMGESYLHPDTQVLHVAVISDVWPAGYSQVAARVDQ